MAAIRLGSRCRRITRSTPNSRTFFTAEGGQGKLESADDWAALALKRGDYKSLVETMSAYGSTQTRDNTHQPHHPLHRPTTPTQLTLSTLIAAGAHLGHSQSLMNSNFLPYAYGERAGITIIDLEHTLPLLRRAANLARAVAARDGTIVFVGTRPELRNVVRKAAERIGEQGYHVGDRWIPGTLTNKLVLHGMETIRSTRVVPDLVVVLNPLSNMNAIRECAIEHVPTIGIIDSNVDPRIVMYPIPANDESTRTAELVAGVLSIAGREGAAIYAEQQRKTEQKERMARESKHRAQERLGDRIRGQI